MATVFACLSVIAYIQQLKFEAAALKILIISLTFSGSWAWAAQADPAWAGPELSPLWKLPLWLEMEGRMLQWERVSTAELVGWVFFVIDGAPVDALNGI